MMKIRFAAVIAAALSLGTHAQTPQKISVVLNGQRLENTALRFRDKYYLSIDDLAKIVNGTVSYAGDRVTLTLAPQQSSDALDRLSPQFCESGRKAAYAVERVYEHFTDFDRRGFVNYVTTASQAIDDADSKAHVAMEHTIVTQLNSELTLLNIDWSLGDPHSTPLKPKVRNLLDVAGCK